VGILTILWSFIIYHTIPGGLTSNDAAQLWPEIAIVLCAKFDFDFKEQSPFNPLHETTDEWCLAWGGVRGPQDPFMIWPGVKSESV
jgi:hypothetical protein